MHNIDFPEWTVTAGLLSIDSTLKKQAGTGLLSASVQNKVDSSMVEIYQIVMKSFMTLVEDTAESMPDCKEGVFRKRIFSHCNKMRDQIEKEIKKKQPEMKLGLTFYSMAWNDMAKIALRHLPKPIKIVGCLQSAGSGMKRKTL